MKKFLVFFLLVAGIAMLHWATHARAMDIYNDRGGNVITYVMKAGSLERRGERVRIFGRCYSACTIYLSVSRLCVGKHAVLGFHTATTDFSNKLMQDMWPPAIKEWAIGLTEKPRYLYGAELRHFFKEC